MVTSVSILYYTIYNYLKKWPQKAEILMIFQKVCSINLEILLQGLEGKQKHMSPSKTMMIILERVTTIIFHTIRSYENLITYIYMNNYFYLKHSIVVQRFY